MTRFLQPSDVPCYRWFASTYCHKEIPLTVRSTDTVIWRCIKSSIQFVIQSTRCELGDGTTISFWYDLWIENGRLSHSFPTLFTFARCKSCTVASQYVSGHWAIQLHPNLSYTALRELERLTQLLSCIPPTTARADIRRPLAFDNKISTAFFTRCLHSGAGTARWLVTFGTESYPNDTTPFYG